MSNLSRTKTEEKKYAKEFLASTHLKLAEFELIQLVKDPPDFVLKFQDHEKSLEVSRLFKKEQKQIESAHDSIVKLAFSKFKMIRNDKLRVQVVFTSNPVRFDTKFFNILAEDLLSHVIKFCLNEKDCGNAFEPKNWLDPHRCFESIYVSKKVEYEGWEVFGAFFYQQIDKKFLMDRISKKEKNIHRYPKNYLNNWLLLVSDIGHESSAHMFDALSRDYSKSKFDKIFVYQLWENKIIDLK